MNHHPFQTLNLANGAKLIFTPCPGTKAVSLEDTVHQFKAQGVSMILTLMFDKEMSENNITTLPELCKSLQINWLQLPITDDEAPQAEFEQQWQLHQAAILNEIKQQGSIAVHCKGGTGRTGTVIALILLQLGWSADKIKLEAQALKPKALRIQKQIDYLNSQLDNANELF